jgi:hypothetical protein
MEHSEKAQQEPIATVPQPDGPISPETKPVLVQGGVAIATILAVTFLVSWLVRLVEASKRK